MADGGLGPNSRLKPVMSYRVEMADYIQAGRFA